MKLFKNEKLEKINKRIVELESTNEKLQGEIDEILQTLEENQEAYALGEITEKDLQKVEKLLKDKTAEIERNNELMQRVKGVRKKVAVESIPFVKEARQKKLEEIDKEWYSKVKELKKAQAEVYLVLMEMAKIRGKASSIVEKYGQKLNELGEEEDYWIFGKGKSDAFKHDSELPINPNPSYFGQDKAMKMSYSVPEYAVRDALSGYVPKWVKEITEDKK